jgi:hypothetical protein
LKSLIKFLPALFLVYVKVLSAQTNALEIQTFLDSNITRNFIYTNFDNNLLSANFLSKLNFTGRKKKVNFFLKNYYSSSVTKLNEKLFRDFDNVKTGVGYYAAENLNLSVNYLGTVFSDDKTFKLDGTSSSMFYASASYDGNVGDASVYSFVNAGYKLEDQLGEKNRGPAFAGEFNIYNLNISDYIIDGQLKLGYENLDPRKNSWVSSRVYFDKSFQDNLAKNEFEGVFSRTKKGYYFPADMNSIIQYGINNNVENRTEYIIKGFDRFDYTISKSVDFYLTLNPIYHDVQKINQYLPVLVSAAPSIYDTDIQDFSINGDAALRFNLKKLAFQIKTSYTERDQRNLLVNPSRINKNFVDQIQKLEAGKDNHSSLFKLSGDASYDVTLSNRFDAAGSASILRYDTPGGQNFDSRDELNFLMYLSHRYNNLKNLELITSVDLNLYHTVYVFAEKSANNNWNRVLRFTSRSQFTPVSWIRNLGQFSILANYTVYDFEDIISTVKSYSYRQLNIKDSLIVSPFTHFGFDIYGEVKLYERGELNWREFSQRPINYFEDKIINSELNYFFNKFTTISGGYRFFQQTRYNYNSGIKVFDTFLRTSGPFVRLSVYWKNNSRIDLITSYDYYKYGDSTPSSSNSSTYINVLWNF